MMRRSRRDILKSGAALGVAASLPACGSASQFSPIPRGGKVLVIGAGFAGIGAANRLIEAGYDVEVIEARNRIGGRAYTRSIGGFPADIGANWLRPTDNMLWDFAKDQDLLSARTSFAEVTSLHGDNRTTISTADAGPLLENALTWQYLRYQARRVLGGRPRAASVEELIGDAADNADALGHAVRALLKTNFAMDLDRLSGAVLLDSAGDAGGAVEPTIVTGMQGLLTALSRDINPRLGETAQAIIRTADGVEVQTDQRQIEADAVILTCSIGVLKSGAIRFEPALPAAHRAALNAMDMGNFCKIWLRFADMNWPFDTSVAVLRDDPLFSAAVDFSNSHGAPVLLAMATGDAADQLEAMGEEAAIALCHQAVQRQLGLVLPALERGYMSNWGSDPLAGGAYMYPNLAYRAGDNLLLREPIAERILLAGEALDVNHGYVDTAWRDGRRAANLIIGN